MPLNEDGISSDRVTSKPEESWPTSSKQAPVLRFLQGPFLMQKENSCICQHHKPFLSAVCEREAAPDCIWVFAAFKVCLIAPAPA